MQMVLDNMTSHLAGVNDPVKKLEKFAMTHLELIEGNPDIAEIIQVELRQSSKFMKEYRNEKFFQYLDIIGDIVKEGQKKGFSKTRSFLLLQKGHFLGRWTRFPDIGYCQVGNNMIFELPPNRSAVIFCPAFWINP